MTGELIEYRDRGSTLMSAADLRTQVNLIQEAMRAVMKANVHYGVIPGCKQPSLYKAGSEVLLTMFHIAVEPDVEELREGDHIRYRVRAVGRHQPTGVLVGAGIGECSTSEDKYAWRNAVCDEEWEDTDPSKRRIKYSKYQGKVEKKKQVRTNPADISNTVLKMAKKRAQIDLTLTATAASDIFTQDIEDLPEELQRLEDERKPRMSPEDVDALKKTLDGAKTKDELRMLLQQAMAKAQEAGDPDAHKAVKDHAITRLATLDEAAE